MENINACFPSDHSVKTKTCQHIVLDAGHIAIESNLVAKEAMEQIEAKKAQQYSDDDFLKLESLMYDRFTVRLESAQVRIFLTPYDPQIDWSIDR